MNNLAPAQCMICNRCGTPGNPKYRKGDAVLRTLPGGILILIGLILLFGNSETPERQVLGFLVIMTGAWLVRRGNQLERTPEACPQCDAVEWVPDFTQRGKQLIQQREQVPSSR